MIILLAMQKFHGIHSAIEELGLRYLWIVYPGDDIFPLDHNITAIELSGIKNAFKFD